MGKTVLVTGATGRIGSQLCLELCPWEQFEQLNIPDEALCIPYGPDGRSWRMHFTHVSDAVQGILLAMLGYDPQFDTKKLIDDALEWREKGVFTIHKLNAAEF
jgi:nucleoside-diphosphate-sugar epimerase